MYCSNCGNKLDKGEKFCTNCGKKIKKETNEEEKLNKVNNNYNNEEYTEAQKK